MAVSGVGSFNSLYEELYAPSKKEAVKKEETKTTANTGISKNNEGKLSSKAQDLLKNIRKQYGDYDIFIGNNTDDLKSLAKSGSKEFTVIFSNTELEKMSSDEKYANEKLQAVEGAVKMSEQINEKYGFQRMLGQGDATLGEISKIGIVFNDDGTTSFFAELEKTSAKQRDRIEKNREENRTEKEIKSYSKGNPETKRTNVFANSMDELLEKIMAVDWSTIKADKIPGSGEKIDYSI